MVMKKHNISAHLTRWTLKIIHIQVIYCALMQPHFVPCRFLIKHHVCFSGDFGFSGALVSFLLQQTGTNDQKGGAVIISALIQKQTFPKRHFTVFYHILHHRTPIPCFIQNLFQNRGKITRWEVWCLLTPTVNTYVVENMLMIHDSQRNI